LGLLDEEETKFAELRMELEPASAGRYLLMEQRPVIVDAWPQRIYNSLNNPAGLYMVR
jgi:hypothetical protein